MIILLCVGIMFILYALANSAALSCILYLYLVVIAYLLGMRAIGVTIVMVIIFGDRSQLCKTFIKTKSQQFMFRLIFKKYLYSIITTINDSSEGTYLLQDIIIYNLSIRNTKQSMTNKHHISCLGVNRTIL